MGAKKKTATRKKVSARKGSVPSKRSTGKKATKKKKTASKKPAPKPSPPPAELELPRNSIDLARCPAFNALELKFKVFILEYLKDFNGARAARVIGVPNNRARVTASEYVSKRNIQDALAEVAHQVIQGEVASVQEILLFLTAVKRGDITDVCRWTESGHVFTKSSDEMDPAKTQLVKKLKVTEKTSAKGDWNEVKTELEIHDPLKAAEMLGRYHAMFKDRVGIGGDPDAPPIQSTVEAGPGLQRFTEMLAGVTGAGAEDSDP